MPTHVATPAPRTSQGSVRGVYSASVPVSGSTTRNAWVGARTPRTTAITGTCAGAIRRSDNIVRWLLTIAAPPASSAARTAAV
jgi:hypothetical protein